jgi:hypothetical protein
LSSPTEPQGKNLACRVRRFARYAA